MKNNVYKIAVDLLCFGATVSSCGLYGKFSAPELEESDYTYGEVYLKDKMVIGEECAANTPWAEFYADPKLAALIDEALENNVSVKSALASLESAQAYMKSARLAYLPTLSFTASGTDAWSGDYKSHSVALPFSASWSIDIFGSLTNAKRKQAAALMASEEYVRDVKASIVSSMAIAYYTLVALEAQADVYLKTIDAWAANVETTEALMNAGKYKASAVHQAKANYYTVYNSWIATMGQINGYKNTINELRGCPSGTPIDRISIDEWEIPDFVHVGIPVEQLSKRPDVKQAELSLAQSFYSLNAARSAMYPTLTITGSYSIYEMVASAVGSLVEPIFKQGQLRAAHKSAKASYEVAVATFRQTLLAATAEVNNALTGIHATQWKDENYLLAVEHYAQALESTQLTMTHGSTTYLEVLTAQQSLLSAQLSWITNKLSCMTYTIQLYQALGGGCE